MIHLLWIALYCFRKLDHSKIKKIVSLCCTTILPKYVMAPRTCNNIWTFCWHTHRNWDWGNCPSARISLAVRLNHILEQSVCDAYWKIISHQTRMNRVINKLLMNAWAFWMNFMFNRKPIRNSCFITSKNICRYNHQIWRVFGFSLIIYGLLFRNISTTSAEKVLQVTELIRFLADVIQTFPGNITEGGWDFIRIAISSWVLTLSKSSEHWKSPKVIFTPI